MKSTIPDGRPQDSANTIQSPAYRWRKECERVRRVGNLDMIPIVAYGIMSISIQGEY